MSIPKHKQFEEQVGRIIRILESNAERVQVNFKQKDPDSQFQDRQIDILVVKGGLVTHIECRDRSGKQGTPWIEELIGRRASLRCDKIIGVSSSGFSLPAVNKAESFGIPLYHLYGLSVEEVLSWCTTFKVTVPYVRILKAEMELVGSTPRSSEIVLKAVDFLMFEAGFLRNIQFSVEKQFSKASVGERSGLMFPFVNEPMSKLRSKFPFVIDGALRLCLQTEELVQKVSGVKKFEKLTDKTDLELKVVEFEGDFSEVTVGATKTNWIFDGGQIHLPDACISTGAIFLQMDLKAVKERNLGKMTLNWHRWPINDFHIGDIDVQYRVKSKT